MKPLAVKRAEAERRNEEWAALSVADRLAVLDARPGRAQRQRAKLSSSGSSLAASGDRHPGTPALGGRAESAAAARGEQLLAPPLNVP